MAHKVSLEGRKPITGLGFIDCPWFPYVVLQLLGGTSGFLAI